MTKHTYIKFCVAVQKALCYRGCDLIEKVNDNYIKLRHVDEFIYIPLCYRKFVNIYYVKDDIIVDVYRDSSKIPYSQRVAKFDNYHRKRNYYKNLENDDSTKTYF